MVRNSTGVSRTYRLLHFFLGGLLKIVFRITAEGRENIPVGQPLIFAANHQAMLDSPIILAVLTADQQAIFMAKHDYFEIDSSHGIIRKWLTTSRRWLVSQSAIPVNRSDRNSGRQAIAGFVDAIQQDHRSVAIHPEGTRAPDKRVYRGKLGFITVAECTGAAIIPVGLIGTREINSPEKRWFRLGKVTVRFGRPIYVGRNPHDRIEYLANRWRRDKAEQVMREIARLAEAEYVDVLVEDYDRRRGIG